MSDDGSTDPYMPDYEEPSMEVVIETLTGTTFEMTVCPSDDILSIKNKIQRVEGIPVEQQHLLYRFKELKNDSHLCDHGVQAGATLCLVLSMRGGPISTRRLTSSEHHLAWREIKEYVDTTREDLLDKLPPGSKVTVLLFRDGENVNLIRVVENEDGSCYPYSEQWPPQKANGKESSTARHTDRTSENNTMMRKVGELRQKMEGLSMQKKTKKPKNEDEDFDLCQPSTSRVSSDAASLGFHSDQVPIIRKENFDARIEKSLSELYSDRLLLIEQRRNSRTNLGRGHFPAGLSIAAKNEDISVPGRNCAAIQTPSIAILEEEPESALNKTDANLSPPNPISVPSGDANTVAMSQIPSLPGTSRNLIHLAHMAHVVLRNGPDRSKATVDKCEPQQTEFCNLVFNEEELSGRRKSGDFSTSKLQNLPKIQNTSASTSRLNYMENDVKHEHNYSSDLNVNKDCGQSYPKGLYSSSSSNLLTSQYASTSKLNSAHLDNVLGDRVSETGNATIYNNERRSPMYGRRARIERIRNNSVDVNSYDNYGYNNLGYNAKIERIQNDAVSINKAISPQYRRRMLNFVSSLEPRACEGSSFELRPFKITSKRKSDSQFMVSKPAATSEEVVQELPTLVPRKRTRCAMCNKRLNITTIHSCRCGGTYCSQHRYSEVHGCHYDYKAEGRKFLEQANPLVAAPKLPKI